MRPEQQLVWYCWIYIVVLSLAILIPYLRRKSDLLTAWNFMLLGLINFIGISGLTAGYRPDLFRIVEFERRDYTAFMTAATIFTLLLFFFYSKLKFPARLVQWRFRKWPPQSPAVLFCMVSLACLIGLVGLFPVNIQGIGQAMAQVGNKGSIFAFAFAFVAWWKQKKNPFLIGILLGTFIYALLLSILGGGGRRNMVGILAVVPITLYWMTLRFRTPKYTIMVLGLSALAGLAVIGAYSEIRHFSRQSADKVAGKERNVANSMAALREIPRRLFSSSTDHFLGQNSVQLSLTAIHVYRDKTKTKPLNALKFILLTPIPRAFWDEKPVGLGAALPIDANGRTRATWGPGIVGHAYHEGGLHMILLYAFLAAFALKFIDTLVFTNSQNSYVLAFLAASSGHLIGWSRGDIGTFTNQVIFCFVAMLLLAGLGRIMFGSRRPYLDTMASPALKGRITLRRRSTS